MESRKIQPLHPQERQFIGVNGFYYIYVLKKRKRIADCFVVL